MRHDEQQRVADTVHDVIAGHVTAADLPFACSLYANVGVRVLNTIDPSTEYAFRAGEATFPLGDGYQLHFDRGRFHCWIVGTERDGGKQTIIDLWIRNLRQHCRRAGIPMATGDLPYLWQRGYVPRGFAFRPNERTRSITETAGDILATAVLHRLAGRPVRMPATETASP